MKEIWKDVVGYEGLYKVSNLGRVKSFINKNVRMMKPSECGNKYLKILACNNGQQYPYMIHRMVARAFIPNPENKPQVNHKDGNKQNNNLNNLEWMTDGENRKHAYATGLRRHRIGADATNVKLTEKDVLFIRSSELNTVQLSKILNISSKQVSAIRRREYWKNI